MSSVFVMIAKFDLPVFEKGDIITAIQDGDDFGVKIKNNPKFKVIEVLNATLEEAEALVLPLVIYNGNPDLQQDLKARQLTVDVDSLLNKTQVTKDYFMSLITRKSLPESDQAVDVVVG
jgi:hypothetical protein